MVNFRFHPNYGFKLRWDLVVILLSIYNSFLIPLQFAIPETVNNQFISVFDVVIDYLFVADIFINFRTIYIEPKTESDISDGKMIVYNYLKGRFIIDLLASVPFEIIARIFTTSKIDENTANFLSMMKLTRLFRLGRMIHYF